MLVRSGSRRRRTGTVLSVVALALGGAACGGEDNEEPAAGGGSSGGGKQTSLSAIVPTPSVIAMYPYYVAREQGYFKREGLNITVNSVDSGPAVTQAAAAGTADIAENTTTDNLVAAAKRPDFRPVMIFQDFQRSPLGVAAPADSGIKTPADLKGKTIGVSSLSAIESNVARGLAAGAGLNPMKDIKLNPVGGGGQAVVALERGDIDAYAGGIADIAIITARGLKMTPVTPPAGKSALTLGAWVKEDLVKSNPEALKGFAKAMADALAYIGTDPEKLVDFASKLSPAQTEERKVALELAKSSIELHAPPAGKTPGSIADEDFARWFKTANQDGVLDKLDPKKFYTNQFINQSG